LLCQRCKQEVPKTVEAPPRSPWPKVCKSCAKFLWIQYDRAIGLERDERKSKAPKPKKKPQPTGRQSRIAEIARSLGANVSAQDVMKVYAAERQYVAERNGREPRRASCKFM
jgi:hypothetical protein